MSQIKRVYFLSERRLLLKALNGVFSLLFSSSCVVPFWVCCRSLNDLNAGGIDDKAVIVWLPPQDWEYIRRELGGFRINEVQKEKYGIVRAVPVLVLFNDKRVYGNAFANGFVNTYSKATDIADTVGRIVKYKNIETGWFKSALINPLIDEEEYHSWQRHNKRRGHEPVNT